jgi:small subunit ribosomal protein S20
MPNIKSAIKRVKVNTRENKENSHIKSEMKTAIKKADVKSAYKKIDKALKKGIIKKNTAARKKSNVAKNAK